MDVFWDTVYRYNIVIQILEFMMKRNSVCVEDVEFPLQKAKLLTVTSCRSVVALQRQSYKQFAAIAYVRRCEICVCH